MYDPNRRAGPLAQLLWDLATLPSEYEAYLGDPEAVLQSRGLKPDLRQFIGNSDRGSQLNELLKAEDESLDQFWGNRVAGTMALFTCWPRKCE